MEPRALSNLNGNLVPAETPLKAPPHNISPTKEFLTFETPASRRETFIIGQAQPSLIPTIPSTPIANNRSGAEQQLDSSSWSQASPTTPYYLSRGAELVQQTCPPKQTGELLFPRSGRIEDHPDEGVRVRLLEARRKSLQWVPRVSSPLGRAVSYGM